jgi:hypothetical protein
MHSGRSPDHYRRSFFRNVRRFSGRQHCWYSRRRELALSRLLLMSRERDLE